MAERKTHQEYEIVPNINDGGYDLKIYTIDKSDKIYPVSWVDVPYWDESKLMVEMYQKKHYPGMKKYFKRN